MQTMSALDTCLREIAASGAYHAASLARMTEVGRAVRSNILAGADENAARLQYLHGELVCYRDMLGITLKALRRYKSAHGHTTPGQWVDVRYYRTQVRRLMLQIMHAQQVRVVIGQEDAE